MHKLTKGLKKKKKGKKSKHKEEELFKPEELEAYRREHAAAGEDSAAKNEEWRNFLSLTSGVDDILKKTQDDLDRIKSTSFFQRIPTKSEADSKKRAVEEAQHRLAEAQAQREQACAAPRPEPQLGIVPVSESESEDEEDDDVFDTAYIDAIATGEVKLAYIPESPTDKLDGDDPFDTSIAERAILGPAVSRKGKKLVPLGAAVEVLTGRVQLPTCATKTCVSRRQILKEKDLLLGSFDSATPQPASQAQASPEQIRTLLDDDEIPLPDEPIDLSRSLYIPPAPQSTTGSTLNQWEEDEDDKEFEALATESLSKTPARPGLLQPLVVAEAVSDWKPFGSETTAQAESEDDPFDTTFADNILPGKAELRLIEKDILDNDVDFDPRAPPDSYTSLQNVALLNGRVPESELKLIAPVHRDLLGGSTSDLSNLGDQPILPIEERVVFEDIKYCDPFDTSIVEAVKAPGQAELKYIEKELLGNLPEDEDFDPRALESKPRTLSRPDVLNVSQAKTVSFSVPSQDLLGPDDGLKVAKPLTPFYVRKNSVALDQDPFDTSKTIEKDLLQTTQESIDLLLEDTNKIAVKVLTPHVSRAAEDTITYADPFDTSIATNILPGKAELRLLENELIEARVEVENNDLLVHSGDTIIEKPLSPQLGQQTEIEETDPFDTSFASNIQPGRAELKVLESELI